MVFSDKKIENAMNIHEDGGTRYPTYERYMAIPGRDLPKRHRDGRGVKDRYKPTTLLKDYKPKASDRLHSSKPKTPDSDLIKTKKRKKRKTKKAGARKAFITTFRSSNLTAIVQRKTKKSTPLKVYWILKPKVQIKAEWKFIKTGVRRAKRVYAKKFRQAMMFALKTARR